MFRPDNDGELWRGLGELSMIGLTLVFAISIGVLVGWWIGKKLGSSTAGIIIGFFVGSIAGFREMFRTVKRYNR